MSENAIVLTDKFIRSVKIDERKEFSDKTQTGLRLRIGASGKKTFAYRGNDRDQRKTTVTIGEHPEISLKRAREEAARIRAELKEGKNPNQEKRHRRAAAVVAELTLDDLIKEFEANPGKMLKVWTPSPKGRSDARRCIECVFGKLLNRPVLKLTKDDFVSAMKGYKPFRPDVQSTANGQVSRARAYLGSVLHWGAGRKKYRRDGAHREEKLTLPDMNETQDPASVDPTITGKREVVLDQDELQRVLPLLKYPAPAALQRRLPAEQDFRPIALRFILLTAARLDEVVAMQWQHVNFRRGTWFKPEVKGQITKNGIRTQTLPLSDAALHLLKSLPHREMAKPDDLVFPNSTGGPLGNWTRFNKAMRATAKCSVDWHRHDLRRTASTLMNVLGVPLSVIDQILAHAEPGAKENASASIGAYVIFGAPMLKNRIDPQKSALNLLADLLEWIEGQGDEENEANDRPPSNI